MPPTAGEHLDQAIERANVHLDLGDAASAYESLLNDMVCHPGTTYLVEFLAKSAVVPNYQGVEGMRRLLAELPRPKSNVLFE